MFIVLLGALDLVVAAACVMVALSFRPRPYFWPRVFLGYVELPSLVLAVVLVTADHVPSLLVCPIGFAALIAVPFASSQSMDPPSNPPRGDDGWGRPGPDRPIGPPPSPRGDVPLPDGAPSRLRVRDHSSPKIPRVTRRRGREHEPMPTPSVPTK